MTNFYQGCENFDKSGVIDLKSSTSALYFRYP